MLEARVLHVAPQVVHVAKVLFPVLVDDGENHRFLQGVEHALALGQDTLLDVGTHLQGLPAVGERDQDVLEVVLLVVVHALNHGVRALGEVHQLGLVQLLCTQVGLVGQLLRLPRRKPVEVHRGLDAKVAQQRHAERFVILLRMRRQHMGLDELVEHVGDVGADAVAVQGVAAALVDDLALGVHHVVVFQKALPDAEVVLLHLLLGPLDALGDHAGLDDLPFFVAHPVHHLAHALRAKQPHQVVLQAHVELARPGVSLTARAAAQLAVHPPAVVTLGADDRQTS